MEKWSAVCFNKLSQYFPDISNTSAEYKKQQPLKISTRMYDMLKIGLTKWIKYRGWYCYTHISRFKPECVHMVFTFPFIFKMLPLSNLKCYPRGTWVAQLVKCLPSAQVMILGSWDRAPHWVPCQAGSLLLPLPLCAHSLSLSR